MVALAKYTSPYALPIDTVIQGDCLEVMSSWPDNCVDAIVSDPPAGINFMNKPFDSDKGGRDNWVAWLSEVMREALRCLKPGGHAVIWALPRTSHWTALALEDAGFTIREKCYHLFGSGFPKSKNLGNGVGSALKPAVEEWILCRKPLSEPSLEANYAKWGTGGINIDACRVEVTEDDPNKRRETGELKPTEYDDRQVTYGHGFYTSKRPATLTQGRFPSNLLLSHSVWCVPLGEKRVPSRSRGFTDTDVSLKGIYDLGLKERRVTAYTDSDGMETIQAYQCHESCPIRLLDEQSGIRNSHGTAAKATFKGMFGNGKPVTGPIREPDQGGASRYFSQFHPTSDDYAPFIYTSKASKRERDAGCEALPTSQTFDKNTSKQIAHINHATGNITYNEYQPSERHNTHPTVKSLSLMKYLVRLCCPPGGTVLDCFMGSGSTCVAAIQEGYHFIGIDSDASYCEIARARIQHTLREVAHE